MFRIPYLQILQRTESNKSVFSDAMDEIEAESEVLETAHAREQLAFNWRQLIAGHISVTENMTFVLQCHFS